ncbi:MAG TPA: YsnF/AvaK domain-containing protein [Candidatus Nitrosocosmicus sp.]
MSSNINWNDTIKKEARGVGDEDLGEVQEVTDGYVLVQRGLINKEKFYIPQDQAESYDGSVLRFRISENEIKSKFMSDLPPPQSSFTKEASSRIQRSEGQQQQQGTATETKIPLTDEKLDVSKESQDDTLKITKEPMKETKTVQVPLTHEEVTIEKRPPSEDTQAETPVSSEQTIDIPVKKEEIGEVSKTPYVREEAVVRKKPVTETKEVTEETTSEKINRSDI